MEKQHRKSRKRRRKQSGDGYDGEPETVAGQIPCDILKRVSSLFKKLSLSPEGRLWFNLMRRNWKRTLLGR